MPRPLRPAGSHPAQLQVRRHPPPRHAALPPIALALACGGHPLPMVLRADGTVEPVGTYGSLIGALHTASFEDRVVRLQVGDTLVMYTDGVTEASVDGDFFGDEGFTRTLSACRGLSAGQIVDTIAAVVGNEHQRDDFALLAIRVTQTLAH